MSNPSAATLRLHRALYAHDAITEAATTFADFASFAVRPDGEHFVVDLTDIDREVEGDVVAEFCNFALANTAIRRKSLHA
ncbi:MAG: HxsD-like protein [Candidatus Binatia bacterium]